MTKNGEEQKDKNVDRNDKMTRRNNRDVEKAHWKHQCY